MGESKAAERDESFVRGAHDSDRVATSIPVLDVVNDHSCFSDSKHDQIVLEVLVEIGLGPQLVQHVDIDVPSIRYLRLVQQRCGALDDTGLPRWLCVCRRS